MNVCAAQPPTIAPWILCTGLSAVTKGKSGWYDPHATSVPAKRYKHITTTSDHSGTRSYPDGSTLDFSCHYSRVDTLVIGPPPATVFTYSHTEEGTLSGTFTDGTTGQSESRSSTLVDGVWVGDFFFGWSPLSDPEATVTFEYTDEDTTADLIARAKSSLPDFVAPPSGAGSAGRDLLSHEAQIMLRRMRWKLRHRPSATCYLKVWLHKRFRPKVGSDGKQGPDTLTPLPTYEWTGTGTPCFSFPDKPFNHDDNVISGAEAIEDPPEQNGYTAIEVTKWSLLRGYTPGNPQPDGSRPSPDKRPNGFPDPEFWEANPPDE